LVIFILSCKPDKANNYEAINDTIEMEIIELNDDEIMIIDSIINYTLILESNGDFYKNDMPVYINNILFVNNDFEGSCGCFDDIIEKHEHTYENMIRNLKNILVELKIEKELILSFIDNNIKKYNINKNIQFKLNIILEEELLENPYLEMTFSNIGFNNDKTELLIHMSINYPNGFGYAKYIYLIKDNEIWNVNNYKYAWLGD
jgi:hypothetical protein